MRRFAELLLAGTCFFSLSLPLRAGDPYVGGYSTLCPPGTVRYGSRCSSGRAPGHPVSGTVSASVSASAPSTRPQSLPLRNPRTLPIAPQMRAKPGAGVARWPSRQRARSSARRAAGAPSSGDAGCREFNARFTPFYMRQAREYQEAGEKQTDTEDRLRGLIEDQKRLRDKLRRQAFQARQFGIRTHLMRQARAVDQDIRLKKRMLERLDARNKDRRRGWQAEFKAKTAAMLKERPPGCRVEVLASGGDGATSSGP